MPRTGSDSPLLMQSLQRRICSRCVMDTTDDEITFDDRGYCNHCRRFFERIHDELPTEFARAETLAGIVEGIREAGSGAEYDCVAGISGGVDSTYVIYQLKKLGLRPLAVHFDNGWNSDQAVSNIQATLDRLRVDLHTEVVDWEEFSDLQRAFLNASVPNCEIPTDHGITATLVRTAESIGTRYVVNGSNLVTEGILPISWVYYSHDLKHLEAIHRRFGKLPLRTFPRLSLAAFVSRILTGRYRMVNLLNYLPYDRESAMKVLAQDLGWAYYGGKHHESVYTRWYQSWYLPEKFGFDKRKAHFSALICAGTMTRDHALMELEKSPSADIDIAADSDFVLRKLGMDRDEFEAILSAPNRKHTDFPNSRWLIEGSSSLREFVRHRAKQV